MVDEELLHDVQQAQDDGARLVTGPRPWYRWIDRKVDRWAKLNAIDPPDGAARALARAYLVRGRSLRAAGAIAGAVLPPAVGRATGLDAGLPLITGPVIGYVIGALAAEMAPGPETVNARRVTSLESSYNPDGVLPGLELAKTIRIDGGQRATVTVFGQSATCNPAFHIADWDVVLGTRTLSGRTMGLIASGQDFDRPARAGQPCAER